MGHGCHERCLNSLGQSDAVRLPTRLIQISSTKSGSVRLYLSSNGEIGRYVALSYCWGGPQQHATTRRNIRQYQAKIPFSKIPKSISDAIRATKELGFQFLWVDSYCIIQDSVNDKEQEISQMGEIYRNAALTICAASSRSVNEGFLQLRTENTAYSQDSRCNLFLEHEDTQRPSNITLDVDWQPQHHGVRSDILNQRGWALQESFLSPRRVYYGSERVFWICPESFQADGGPITRADKFIKFQSFTIDEPKAREQPHSKLSTAVAWSAALKDYSTRDLTQEQDKLPALSAIAKVVQKQLGWTYLAGLWRENLISDLLWERVSTVVSRMPKTWRAPSWSWASLDAPIEYDWCHFHIQSLSKVLSCTTVPLHSMNPFGQIRKAELVIRGHIRPICLAANGELAYTKREKCNSKSGEAPDSQLQQTIGRWRLDREEPLYSLHPIELEQLRRSSMPLSLTQLLLSASDPAHSSIAANREWKGGEIVWCLTLGHYRHRSDWQPSFYQMLRISDPEVEEEPSYNKNIEVYKADSDLKPSNNMVIGLLLMKTGQSKYQRVGTFASLKHSDTTDVFMEAPIETITII